MLIGGELPRLEGELVIAAIDAFAERLRSEADHVPAGSRRADALVALVNNAYAADVLPSRGGLPVGLTVTLDHTALGDPLWSTSRGHLLTQGEARWAACDAAITPILVSGPGGEAPSPISQSHPPLAAPTSAARVAALAAAMFAAPAVLDVGRTQRTATASQRRALAARDRGCIIPGCGIPAEACQTHHITEWQAGGETSLGNLCLLCWAHHRQVDLRMWTITPNETPAPTVPARSGWAGNNGSPFSITRTPRTRWRL